MVTIASPASIHLEQKINLNHMKMCTKTWILSCEIALEIYKILTYSQEQHSMKTIFIIYADTKFLPEKVHICQNNRERSFTSKIDRYNVWLFSIYAGFIWCYKKINMITSEVFLLEENNKNNKDKHISKSASVLIINHELCVKRTPSKTWL